VVIVAVGSPCVLFEMAGETTRGFPLIALALVGGWADAQGCNGITCSNQRYGGEGGLTGMRAITIPLHSFGPHQHQPDAWCSYFPLSCLDGDRTRGDDSMELIDVRVLKYLLFTIPPGCLPYSAEPPPPK
jgi:hypothetical protein